MSANPDFYTELHDDEFRVFLLRYYYKFNYDHGDHFTDQDKIKPFLVSEIREENKKFNKDGLTDEEFADVLKKLRYIVFHPQSQNLAMSHINGGIVSNICEKILLIVKTINDEQFTAFLCRDVDVDKRRIFDKINKCKTDVNSTEVRRGYLVEEIYLKLILDEFYPLALYCQECYGKFIF